MVNRVLLWTLLLTQGFVLAVMPVGADAPAAAAQTLLVKFSPDVTEQAAAALLTAHGAIEMSRLGGRNRNVSASTYRWWTVKFAPETDISALRRALLAEPSVEAVETEQTYHVLPKSDK